MDFDPLSPAWVLAVFGKPEVQVNFVPSFDCSSLVLELWLSRGPLLSKLLLHDELEQQNHCKLVPLLHGSHQGPHRTLESSLCMAEDVMITEERHRPSLVDYIAIVSGIVFSALAVGAVTGSMIEACMKWLVP
jgi:hypothetical protein